jgi:hypothetical protein
MSVLPPPSPDDEEAFQEAVEHEVEQVEVPSEMPEPRPTGSPIKDVCKHCMRPVVQITPEDSERFHFLTLANYPSGWAHWDGRIDQPNNVSRHVAELFVEPPVKWGFLDPKGKSNFEVKSGPSKVRSGWSGGGVS